MDGLTEGRIVHFVLTKDEHRPATVVKVWDTDAGLVNLNVQFDGSNDHRHLKRGGLANADSLIAWRTSVKYDKDKAVGTWHWPERA